MTKKEHFTSLEIDITQIGERYRGQCISIKGILESVYEPHDEQISLEEWVTRQYFKLTSKDKMKTVLIVNDTKDSSYFTRKDVGCELIVEGTLYVRGMRIPGKKKEEKYYGYIIYSDCAKKNIDNPEPVPIVKTRQNIPGYNEWRKTVISRDKYCAVCGGNKSLEAHHIYGYKKYPLLRTDPENGVTVCKYCHDRYHAYYGVKDITPNRFIKYLRQFIVR